MKTAFFASDSIALDAIEALHNSEEYKLVCVVSNPDKPKGRGKKLTPNDVSAWAIGNGVELMRPENGVDDATVARLRELDVELIVVMAYGHMLGDNVLNYGKYPCLNLHGSILPKLRGASPIESAILLGDAETGVSLMRIVKKMDAGAVCDIEKISIESSDTSQTLRSKFRKASAVLLMRNLPAIENGEAVFVEQKEEDATYTRKFDKSDAVIDFFANGKAICDRIRAFGFGSFERNGEIFKVADATFERSSDNSISCGTILDASANGLLVSCADGAVKFMSLQKPCAKMMSARDFFMGYKIEKNEVLKSSSYKNILK